MIMDTDLRWNHCSLRDMAALGALYHMIMKPFRHWGH